MELYKPLPLLLATAGFFFFLRKEKLRIFIIWALITFIFIKIFHYYGVSILAPYQRMLYYFMLSAVPLSAIGLYQLLSYFWKFMPKKIALFLIIILVGLLFYYQISLTLPEKNRFYHTINDHAYDAIKFLESQEKSTVIASKNTLSMAVYPISGQMPIATLYFHGDKIAKVDLSRFFGASCSAKEEIIRKYDAMYVIDTKNCGWEKIYDKGFIIYKVK